MAQQERYSLTELYTTQQELVKAMVEFNKALEKATHQGITVSPHLVLPPVGSAPAVPQLVMSIAIPFESIKGI